MTPSNDGAKISTHRRLLQLDVLRGIAVVLVLLNHRPHLGDGPPPGLLDPWLRLPSGLYWTGVDLFFVLSGYLVGGILIAEMRATGRIDLKRFWIRRGLKIWPSYYLYLVVLSVLTALFYVDTSYPGAQWTGVWINLKKLFYVQNYFTAERPGPVPHMLGGHTWTLAVEEHFYLLLPLLLAFSGRYWRKALPAVALGLLVICLAFRLRNFNTPMNWVWDYQVTHKRIDSLFFGAFLAYLSQTRPWFSQAVARFRLPLLAAGLLLISPMLFQPLGTPFVKTFGFLMLALGYGCILLAFVSTPLGEGVFGRALDSAVARGLAWVGFWSYSIYLWHMDLEYLFQALTTRAGGRWFDLWVLAYLAASIGLGVFMGRLVEGPALAWRDRHFPSRSPAPPLSLAPEPGRRPEREDREGEALDLSRDNTVAARVPSSPR